MEWENYEDFDTDLDVEETNLNASLDEENDYSDYDTDKSLQEIIPVATQKGRRNIRHIKELEDLKLDTRIANQNERERLIRIENCEKQFKEILGGHILHDELILDYDFENNLPLVSVHKALVQKMKDHQKEGVKFMWNACYESLKQIKESDGSGCIIAHCMGLGKTFQVIALVHTLLNHPEVKTRSVLICCPKNTLMNWINEFQKWITPDLGHIGIFNPTQFDNNSGRLCEILKWQSDGGVCILNYELIRILLEDGKKEKAKFHEHLCNPGPDLVICDEGHVLKNEETKLAKLMSQIRTLRRIILTGTPMQNNLKEYHCMVQFVKPNLLGTRKEFVNMFVNPILNGQYENSSVEDVQLMKERSHILHKKLSGVVQRYDLSTLRSFLPEKQEYVISLALTESQINMYKHYLKNYSAKGDPNWKYDGVALFADYQSLQRIWTHPYTLKIYADKHQEGGKTRKKKTKKKKNLYGDESDEESSDSESFRWSRFPLFWWVRFVESDDIEDARQSNKLTVLLKILKECEDAEEKILVFSGSLYSLRLIQHFLKKINKSEFEDPSLCNMTSTWEEESDYVVLTGQTSSEDRDRYCQSFNDLHNQRLRLFLISTKAGGMGINLTAASRAIIFDASWNPSHDIQSIFRIYRIGQKRPCFVYRFVASGTMEEKIYERQVAKESISYRVVDEKQIARHYTQNELLQLYMFEPNKKSKMEDVKPKDPIFLKVFEEESERIVGIHEHESLLEHKKEEELQELEKNDAWTAYNNVDDLKHLPVEERKMLSELKPECYDPKFFKMVLKKEFPEATEEEITLMMTELKPQINSILERPDFVDLMKKQAFLHHNSRRSKTKSLISNKISKKTLSTNKKNDQGKENTTITLSDSTMTINDSPITKPGTSGTGYCSGSDDSVFMYNVESKRKKKKKPLKVWGVRNGVAFGSPDRDS